MQFAKCEAIIGTLRYDSFAKIWFVAVTGKLFEIVYCSNYPMSLYFQVQFLKLKCTENAKSIIKSASEKDQKKKCKELKRDIETLSQVYSIKKKEISGKLWTSKRIWKKEISGKS